MFFLNIKPRVTPIAESAASTASTMIHFLRFFGIQASPPLVCDLLVCYPFAVPAKPVVPGGVGVKEYIRPARFYGNILHLILVTPRPVVLLLNGIFPARQILDGCTSVARCRNIDYIARIVLRLNLINEHLRAAAFIRFSVLGVIVSDPLIGMNLT